jgi:hypothetical protein
LTFATSAALSLRALVGVAYSPAGPCVEPSVLDDGIGGFAVSDATDAPAAAPTTTTAAATAATFRDAFM